MEYSVFSAVKAKEKGYLTEVVVSTDSHEYLSMLDGYDIETITKVNKLLNIPIIASGGAGNFENMLDLIKSTNVSALAAASIYHFTKKTPLDVKKYLKEKKIPVRL